MSLLMNNIDWQMEASGFYIQLIIVTHFALIAHQ